jgi:hypothetical protein
MDKGKLGTVGGALMPRIKNIGELVDEMRRPVLLHFTSEQWKPTMEGMESGAIEKVKDIPKGHIVLEIMPLPGAGGGVIIGEYMCPENCTSTGEWACAYPDDFTCVMTPQCICDPKLPPIENGNGGEDECRLGFILNISGDLLGPQIACVDNAGNRCTDFRPVWVQLENGHWLLTCAPR